LVRQGAPYFRFACARFEMRQRSSRRKSHGAKIRIRYNRRVPTLALATAISACGTDADLLPLQDACAAEGLRADIVAWDDPTVSWSRFDAVLLRSTWDYSWRLPEFLAWCGRVSARVPLLNPLEVVRWNTDKRYLGELAAKGLPVTPSHYVEPGGDASTLPDLDEFVVKPCIAAGSRGARRFVRADRDAAIAHAQALLAEGRSVLVQPYLAQVDAAGETGLVFFDGRYSHAIRKGPLLRRGEPATRALFAPEHIGARTPSDAEREVAKRVLAALPFERLAYARVDVLPSAGGPMLLELELTEPSLFFATAPGAAQRFARVLAARLQA
jgi:glutathione synthase/RimK-type ligase-like ATP-grasp enzyme